MTKATIAISIGSNTNRAFHLKQAVFLLRPFIDVMKLSPAYESQPVNFNGENFINIVLGGQVDLDLTSTLDLLKSLEKQYKRNRDAANKSLITLDLDLLIYDDYICEQPIQLPRPEILTNAYVLWPLQDIFPDLHHPSLKKTYAQLWKEYNNPEQQLWPIEFNWN